MADRTPLDDFHNRLRILNSIDLHELQDVGVAMTSAGWTDYALNPWRWFITASDADRAKVWTVMDRRSGS